MKRAAVASFLVLAQAAWADSEPPPQPPGLRLGDGARPVRYAARLRVIPGEPTFAGAIDIEVALARPSRVVWMNGSELTISAAAFEVGGAKVAARPVAGGPKYVGFQADRELPAGALRLHVEYTGNVQLKDDRGLFAQREGDRWYAFTQLEAISARRVFPCFD